MVEPALMLLRAAYRLLARPKMANDAFPAKALYSEEDFYLGALISLLTSFFYVSRKQFPSITTELQDFLQCVLLMTRSKTITF